MQETHEGIVGNCMRLFAGMRLRIQRRMSTWQETGGNDHRGICHLSFVESEDGKIEWTELQEKWPQAELHRDDPSAAQLVGRIFERSAYSHWRPTLRAVVRGTEFQVRVWQALLQVRPGTLVSYRNLAAAVGKPTAARVSQNRLARSMQRS